MTPSGGLCLSPLGMINAFLVKTNQRNIFSGTSNSSKVICCSFASLTNSSDVLIRYQPSRSYSRSTAFAASTCNLFYRTPQLSHVEPPLSFLNVCALYPNAEPGLLGPLIQAARRLSVDIASVSSLIVDLPLHTPTRSHSLTRPWRIPPLSILSKTPESNSIHFNPSLIPPRTIMMLPARLQQTAAEITTATSHVPNASRASSAGGEN